MRPCFPGVAFLLLTTILPLTTFSAEPISADKAQADPDGKLHWYDLRLLTIEGRGWNDTKSFYDRLPASAEAVVRPLVWDLSRDSAGISARFVTSSPAIHVRWTLSKSGLSMPHMPATGVSGLDLYVSHAGKWRWLAGGRPTAKNNRVELVTGLPPGAHEYRLYLPLYNGVSSVDLGISSESTLAPAPLDPMQKAIVFYGTSITQGGCATRPGMTHVAILGRRLNVPVINLGFSGNGKMEPEMADLLIELDPALYVLDCVPNMTVGEVTERVEPFVKKLRAAHPDCPILLVEEPTFCNAFLLAEKQKTHNERRAAYRASFERLQAAGIVNLYYQPGDQLFDSDGEATVDGVHPTDLGFVRIADVLEPVLRQLIDRSFPPNGAR